MNKRKSKRAQEQKSEILASVLSKRAQEEIIGFGVILIIIAVIALIFLSLSINRNQKEEIEDFEASSFVKALMEKTTNCEKNSRPIAIKDLIFECGRTYNCIDGNYSCDILEDALKLSLQDNWNVGNNTPIKGYNLIIIYEDKLQSNLSKGVVTQEYKGTMQDYSKLSENAEIYFNVYS